MKAFIDDYRDIYGVSSRLVARRHITCMPHVGVIPICAMLAAGMTRHLGNQIGRVWEENFHTYGARKCGSNCRVKACLLPVAQWNTSCGQMGPKKDVALVYHSDRSVGDSCDNALAETINGLLKQR